MLLPNEVMRLRRAGMLAAVLLGGCFGTDGDDRDPEQRDRGGLAPMECVAGDDYGSCDGYCNSRGLTCTADCLGNDRAAVGLRNNTCALLGAPEFKSPTMGWPIKTCNEDLTTYTAANGFVDETFAGYAVCCCANR
jgi:hypothetical protein